MDEDPGFVIRAGTALLGEDLLALRDAEVLVRAGEIVSHGPAHRHPGDSTKNVLEFPGLTLLPGFIDAHVHIGFVRPADVALGGVTTVRDLGWPRDAIGKIVKKSQTGGFEGPEVVAAGPILTAPGGYPTRAAWAPEGTGLEVASAGEARIAVHELATWGSNVIKVALNPAVGPMFDLDTLRAIVAAAHANGLRVTGHVTGLEALELALAAGMDELAHMLMGEDRIPHDTIEAMAAAGMAVVPTLAVRNGEELELAIGHLERFAAAGGRVVYGTDLGDEGPLPGIDAREIAGMSAARMSPMAIIASATVEAANWLLLHDRGALEVGRRADVIGVEGDPTRRAEDLLNVRFVMRRGRILRGT